MHLVCLGLGYSARAFVQRLRPRGWHVTGTTTTADGLARITSSGLAAAFYDGTARSTDLAAALKSATHLLASAAPDAEGDPLLRHHAADIADAPNLGWVGYLSTVGVYGDHEGRWVTEDSDLKPVSQRSRQRVAAEAQWLHLSREAGKRVQLFRLAGIYGPGRSAIDNLRAGIARRIVKPDQVFNRIHVDDIANVLEGAIDTPRPAHNVFNVADDEPGPPQDVVEFAARLVGMPVPPAIPFDQANLSPMGRSFYGENKRVANARIKADLGVTLLYPTYREGMTAIAAASPYAG